MSNADPRWGPPQYRPHPISRVLAVVLPLVFVLALLVPAGVVLGWRQLRSAPAGQAEPTRSDPPVDPDDGQPGVGDPYFPDYGSSGYDAIDYTIAMTFDPASATITATTTIRARATQRLDSFYVDLALDVRTVSVGGRPARADKEDFQDVKITPETSIASGAEFQVVIEYAGRPGEVKRGRTTPYLQTGQEWMVSGEPESSAWWFPANDHPSDPALMDVSIRVPAGMEAISVGRLESRDTADEADFDTWHWVARQPMATYLNFFAVGQYDIETGVTDKRPYVYAVSQQLPGDQRAAAMTALRTTGAVVRGLERTFGPYPFTEIGGIVPAHDLWFDGLETQTRPIYKASSIAEQNYSAELIAHELAHMWFGDNVTVREWNDIFINEAYASYAQWVYTAQNGGSPPNDRFLRTYDRAKDRAEFWQVTMIDPGRERLFSTVYARGPMTLQALRNVIGGEAFDRFSRAWAAEAGSRSLEEWMVKAQASTKIDLVPFFQAWIFGTVVPARTAANGFR